MGLSFFENQLKGIEDYNSTTWKMQMFFYEMSIFQLGEISTFNV